MSWYSDEIKAQSCIVLWKSVTKKEKIKCDTFGVRYYLFSLYKIQLLSPSTSLSLDVCVGNFWL